jgi:arylsulfatase A-like enzyme
MENTVIMYTSDHGDMRMDHFLWRKSFPFEGSSHVPLIMWWPESLSATFGTKRSIKIENKVTELRDILPTFLDALGRWNSTWESAFDGRPLTWLLRGTDSNWRQWLDMEHNIYCRTDNHWNALTDGKMKYIFHAWNGAETLFNLTADPQETYDLAYNASFTGVVSMWRRRMVKQFEKEGRGSKWTLFGKLLPRPYPINFSPHWPGKTEVAMLDHRLGIDSSLGSVTYV